MIRSSVLIVFYLIFTGLNAQDFYVSEGSGLDTNDGSLSSPFKTINKGILQVEAGGTVYVMNGTYQNSGYGTVTVST